MSESAVSIETMPITKDLANKCISFLNLHEVKSYETGNFMLMTEKGNLVNAMDTDAKRKSYFLLLRATKEGILPEYRVTQSTKSGNLFIEKPDAFLSVIGSDLDNQIDVLPSFEEFAAMAQSRVHEVTEQKQTRWETRQQSGQSAPAKREFVIR